MSSNVINQKLTRIFQEIFDDDSIILSDETSAKDIDEWDSLNHITLVLAIEREFSIHLNAAEVGSLENVGQMIKLIDVRTSQ